MEQVLEGLRAIAEETRLRLLVICNNREFTVSELTRILGQSQPRVSRHLKLLCDAGLLERFREQNFVLYRVSQKGMGGQLSETILKLLPVENEVLRLDRLRIKEVLKERAIEAKETLDHLPIDFHGFKINKIDESRVDQIILDLTSHLQVGELLDIGTGTGRMLRLLSSRTNKAVGIDISPQMLRLARAQLSEAGLGKFSVRYGDMYHLDFPNASFDTVTIDQVLTEAHEPLRVLEEASRLIRPGGNLILVAYQDEACKDNLFSSRKDVKKNLADFDMDLNQLETVSGGRGQVVIICGRKRQTIAGIA